MIPWFFKHPDKVDKKEILRRISLFVAVPEPELRLLANETRLVEYKKGDLVYREGDPADCFYAIVSGRVKVFTMQEQLEKVFAYLYEGDYFGELSLLTGEPHSVNVVVMNDSLLLRVEKESFTKIIEHYPQVTVQLSRLLGNRLRQKDREGEKIKHSKIISIYSAVPEVGKTLLALNLTASITAETHRNTILIDFAEEGKSVLNLLKLEKKESLDPQKADISLEEIQKYVSIHPLGFHVLEIALHTFKEGEEKKLMSLFSRLIFSYDFIVLVLPVKEDANLENIFTQSDLIYLVTDGEEEHFLRTKTILDIHFQNREIRKKVRVILNERRPTHDTRRRETFLGEKVDHFLPHIPTIQDHLERKEIFFVIGDPSSNYSKTIRYMAREVGDILVGLALSSGAALGLSHIGVLKVLVKEKIPIDIISGTSMGAIVASAWACGKSPDEMEEIVEKLSSPSRTFALLADFDFFWNRGFFRGIKVTQFLRTIFGDQTFRDASLPVKVVAVNLNTREEKVFEEGPFFKAVRASISIPGILQPFSEGGQVFVDGAVVSPVPIECLRRAGVNKIIAVNALPSPHAVLERRKRLEEADQKKWDTVSKRNVFVRFLYLLRKRIAHLFVPNIFDIMMQSMQTMEYQVSEIACRNADVVIRPTNISAGWFEFFEAKKFIRRGEEEARKHVAEIKQLVFEQKRG